MTTKEIMQNAIDTYGADSQVDMAIEEMSELIKSLLKNRRALKAPEAWDYEKTRTNIIEEIADVEIMLAQCKMMFQCEDEVQDWKDKKLKRLQKRLEG